MRILLICTACLLAWPASLWAAPELLPTNPSFAYSDRHGVVALSSAALKALQQTEAGGEGMSVTDYEPPMIAADQRLPRVFSRSELGDTAAFVAEANDLPVSFFTNLIQQESGFKSHVVSSAGAQGIAQFMPRTAAAYGLTNPFDPIRSLMVSGEFLNELLEQFGNVGLAAAAYNAGPGRVLKWMAKRGQLPAETRNYVQVITGRPAEHWARSRHQTDELKLPAHARCPGMPAIEVHAPEGAPFPAEAVTAASISAPAKKSFVLAAVSLRKKVVVSLRKGGMRMAQKRGVRVAQKSESRSKSGARKKNDARTQFAVKSILARPKPVRNAAVNKKAAVKTVAVRKSPAGKPAVKQADNKRVRVAAAR